MNTKTICLIALLALGATLMSGCGKERFFKSPCAWCGTENPLEDMKWLNNIVEQYDENHGGLEICICTYDGGKQGFLIAYCTHCDDRAYQLFDCSGNSIGTVGGIAGIPYSEYDIDPESVEVFYKIES